MNWLLGFVTDKSVVATLFAAAIGFGGVIVTLVLQHQADVVRDKIRADEHRQSVAAAFAVELRNIEKYAIDSVSDLKGPELTTFLVPTTLPFVLFEALKGELHSLSATQIEKLVACYVWLPEISARLRMLAGSYSNPDGVSVMLLAQHAHIYEFLMGQLQKLARDALDAVES